MTTEKRILQGLYFHTTWARSNEGRIIAIVRYGYLFEWNDSFHNRETRQGEYQNGLGYLPIGTYKWVFVRPRSFSNNKSRYYLFAGFVGLDSFLEVRRIVLSVKHFILVFV